MSFVLRPLGKVREMVQAIGYDITYAYDDLVFADHSLFILRFDDTNSQHVFLYINSDCNKETEQEIISKLLDESKRAQLTIEMSGHFSIDQKENSEELELIFK